VGLVGQEVALEVALEGLALEALEALEARLHSY
jgi:hypothetical protein